MPLTITFDNGEHGPGPRMGRVDKANEENTAEVQEDIEALVDLHGDLVGQDLRHRQRYSHDHENFRVQGRECCAQRVTGKCREGVISSLVHTCHPATQHSLAYPPIASLKVFRLGALWSTVMSSHVDRAGATVQHLTFAYLHHVLPLLVRSVLLVGSCKGGH